VTYDSNGHFKLTVFSDLHYGEAEDLSWGPEQDRNSDIVMRTILKMDPPNYVVINGDLITGESKGVSSDSLLYYYISQL
jgi:metallophosphoesterase superfamily enzyme